MSFNASSPYAGVARAAAPLVLLAAEPRPGTLLFEVSDGMVYAMLVLALVQVIFVVALAGVLRTLGEPGGWVRKLMDRSGRTLVLLPLALVATQVNAQAYAGDGNGMEAHTLFWILAAVNLLLFILILVQVALVRNLTLLVSGRTEAAEEAEALAAAVPAGPTWWERMQARMTKQVAIEKEDTIELDHDYDGIKELDNVLPPWWLWLFYGSIAWGVLYLVNVHVINVWPDQDTAYVAELEQARVDIAAYQATQRLSVDENSVTFTDDAGVIATGRDLFTTYCVACHGPDAAGSETSVGPNLTDAYWLHGGSINDVFRTIKYGVIEKGMASWKTQLQPAQISAVSSYIISLAGTGGPTQKAPEGELYVPAGAEPADSSAVPVAADTVIVAVR